MELIKIAGLSDQDFFWLNLPDQVSYRSGVKFKTKPNTDFWQRTHYGFCRDNGHCLLAKVDYNFSISVRTRFQPLKQYDQCGLMVRLDPENWIKVSTEYETENKSRLGSVVTNNGFSDWATTDIEYPLQKMWYRIQNNRNDFLIENSFDGEKWSQMRIAHLHKDFVVIEVGMYACSPMESACEVEFDCLTFGKSDWR
jgi:regulation of enolase protein 1 (concanavalin A-like superfamily)